PEVFIEAKNKYAETRNYPTQNTSYLGTHLRFGTVSIREIIRQLAPEDETFLSELIWREFFIQILYHFPKSVNNNFKSKYDGVQWINNKDDFKAWCEGKTGYPMVDAGMRQLNATGWMHNRVRMVTASFLCKHLLIDWRWGEAYFAKKLLDFELASNVGNWQWAAGTGCDAAPYFRIFNPMEQHKKFDPKSEYVKTWVPEWSSLEYLAPIVEHKMARQRCLETYKSAL
ncbi:MAG: DNA photolyase family protein, partial [Schleiferiaceae bacterium]|nr:DNA photolyase family protein [Schleiferiaceae bacterium]